MTTDLVAHQDIEAAIRAARGNLYTAAESLCLQVTELRAELRKHPKLAEVAGECRRQEFEQVRAKVLSDAAAGNTFSAALAIQHFNPDTERLGSAGQGVPDFSREIDGPEYCTDAELEALCRRKLDECHALGVCPTCGHKVRKVESVTEAQTV